MVAGVFNNRKDNMKKEDKFILNIKDFMKTNKKYSSPYKLGKMLKLNPRRIYRWVNKKHLPEPSVIDFINYKLDLWRLKND